MTLLRRIGTAAFLAMLPGWSAASSEWSTYPNEWTPDAAAVSQVDALALKLKLPAEFGAMSDYSRFYYGTVRNGKRVVEGVFLSPAVEKSRNRSLPGGVHIVSESMAIGILDGGCNEVNVEFDVQSKKIEEHCN